MNGQYTEAELARAGEALGRSLPSGSVIWLEGELGAGKTTLAQAIARGRGVTAATTSPTYDLVHRYEGVSGSVFHVDCYRLRQPEDAADLDWATIAGGDLLVIEWPERAGEWATRPTLRLRLLHDEDELVRCMESR